MVGDRGGRARLGCLFTVLLAVSVMYFGFDVGEVYWRYYRFQDAMGQEARFAGDRSSDEIRTRLLAVADSLGLPDDAVVRVHRSANRLEISAEWVEHVELPLRPRDFHFAPHLERQL